MEEKYTYQVNTIMPIIGLSVGVIKVPTSLKLTKEDVLICLKKAPVFRRFSDGNKERVGIDNIDRLHRENYMTVEEYNEYLSNKTTDTVVEEEPSEPIITEESEPEVPVVEEIAEDSVEEEEVYIPVPDVAGEQQIEEEVTEEETSFVANELFEEYENKSDEEETKDNTSKNNYHNYHNKKRNH